MPNVPQKLDPPRPYIDPPLERGSAAAGKRKRGLLNPSLEGPGADQAERQIQQHHVWIIWFFQAVVLIASMGFFWLVGASWFFWGTALIVYVGICIWLGCNLQRKLKTPDPLPRKSVLLALMKFGVWVTSFAFWLAAEAILLRTSFGDQGTDLEGPSYSWIGPVVICVFLVIFGVLTYIGSRYAIRNGRTPWFQFSIGVILAPLLAAWFAASLVATAWQSNLNPVFSAKELEDDQVKQKQVRGAWASSMAWKRADGKPVVVAVALSGGGYRAATFHAGVLQTLDDHNVPVRYITSVSGGSIVGTYYALGNSPEKFKERLIKRKPGLPDTLLSMWYVAMDLFWPGWSSADTYSMHFKTAFFDSKTLGDTGTHPQLIVNVTDIEKAEGQREVLYKDRDPKEVNLNKVKLADIVAASGAFPGPFQPKEITWPDIMTGTHTKRKFVDGGVYENLGYTGLGLFMVVEASKQSAPDLHPSVDILIVSDASAGMNETHLPVKTDLVSLLSRSEGISYQSLLNHLKIWIDSGAARPTGLNADVEWIRPLGPHAESNLAGETFKYKGKEFAGIDVAKNVSRFRTLQELDEPEVERSFWLGRTLAAKAWPGIDRCRQLRAKDAECVQR